MQLKQVNNELFCLLIGNSRWHWAIGKEKQWSFFHTSPEPNKVKTISTSLIKWAAVGPIPNEIQLDPARSIKIQDIPLKKLPNWIGIDRALVGWAAFKKAKSKNLHKKGVLIADAGTILSLTCINSKGEFTGGQLIPGLKLQRSAMSEKAYKLQPIQIEYMPKAKFPISTQEAMLRGSLQALLGALIEAHKETQMPIWLCGGDSEILYEHLKESVSELHHCPDLMLEAMVGIDI